MIFSHLTRIVAILAVLIGIGTVLMGVYIAVGYAGPPDLVLRGFATATTPGQVIDKGFFYLLVGLALGTLAEIGLAVRKGSR
jgi:hypothetical protein